MPSYCAPALQFVVARSRSLLWTVSAASMLTAVTLTAWGLQAGQSAQQAQPAHIAIAIALWIASSAGAIHWVRSLPCGVLSWDGARWQFQPSPSLPLSGAAEREAPRPALPCIQPSMAPRIHLDGQDCVLLSLRPTKGRPLWLWVERRMHPPQWQALRRALYAAPPTPQTAPG